MTAPDARQTDELRGLLAEAIPDWTGLCDDEPQRLADALVPVVTAYAESLARARAAEELQAAAAEIDGDGQGGFPGALRLIGSTDILRTRADALTADDQPDPS